MRQKKLNNSRNIRKLIYIICVFFLLSCNNSKKEDSKGTLETTSETKQPVDLVDRYVGAWKFVKIIPDNNHNDHSLDGIICQLERYQNTNETFVFHLFTGNELILSVKDENNLVGENANMKVEYKVDEKHLYLSIPNGSTWVFKKLK